MDYQGKGTAKCGYARLCEECYNQKVKHVYKVVVKKKNYLLKLLILILGILIGGNGVFIFDHYIYKKPKDMTTVRMITEREKQILVNWAMSKSENTSEQIIRQMVDVACESEFPALIMAIIGAETLPKFDPGSVSNKDCWGPMQVNPPVWVKTLTEKGIIKNEKDLFDPTLGVRAGIFVFCRDLEAAKGNLREATRRYLEGIHVKNPKGAEKYFNLIQQYLGEIYLAMYRERQKQKQKTIIEEVNE
jgi:hypothetical protein